MTNKSNEQQIKIIIDVISGVNNNLSAGEGPRAMTLKFEIYQRVLISGSRVRCIVMRYTSILNFMSIGDETYTLPS